MKDIADVLSELIQRVGIPVAVMIYYLVKDYQHGNKIIEANNNIIKTQEAQVAVQEKTNETLGKLIETVQEQRDLLVETRTKIDNIR